MLRAFGAGPKDAMAAVKTGPGPVSMSCCRENEEITFKVTVTSTGGCELNNPAFCDSLAGFAPTGTLASLPAAGSRTFTWKHTVKKADMSRPTLANSAAIRYTFPGNPAACGGFPAEGKSKRALRRFMNEKCRGCARTQKQLSVYNDLKKC